MGWVIAAAMLASGGWWLTQGYSPVPKDDYWDHINWLRAIHHRGTIHAGDFWRLANEHRIVLPRLAFLADDWLARSRGTVAIMAIIAIQLIHGLVWVRLIMASDLPRLSRHLMAALALGLCLSMGQTQNLTWGNQVQFVLVFLAGTLAWQALAREGRNGILLACLWAAVSSLSMANGLLCGIVLVMLAWAQRRPAAAVLALAAFTLAAFAAYLWDYRSPPPPHTTPADAIRQLDRFIIYVCFYLGAPVATGARAVGALTGLAGLLVAAGIGLRLIFRRPAMDRLDLVCCGSILFVAGTAVITGIGRFELGTEQAISSRYMTPVYIFWIAIFVLLTRWLAGRPVLRHAGLALAGIWLAGFVIPDHIKSGLQARQYALKLNTAGIALIMQVDDAASLRAAYPVPEIPFTFASFLRAERRALFDTPLARLPGSASVGHAGLPHCNGRLDVTARAGERSPGLRFEGWLMDPGTGAPPPFLAMLDGRGVVIGLGATGYRRNDVRRVLGLRTARLSGFVGYAGPAAEVAALLGLTAAGDAVCMLPVR